MVEFAEQFPVQELGVIATLTIAGVLGAAPKTTGLLAVENGPGDVVCVPLTSLEVAVT